MRSGLYGYINRLTVSQGDEIMIKAFHRKSRQLRLEKSFSQEARVMGLHKLFTGSQSNGIG